MIAVLNNRRQTANGTIKDFSSSHETSRNQFPSARTGGPSRSVVEPSHDREQVKVQIVRSVDFKADSDMELGTMQSKVSSSQVISSERLTERMSEESQRNELGINHSSLSTSRIFRYRYILFAVNFGQYEIRIRGIGLVYFTLITITG